MAKDGKFEVFLNVDVEPENDREKVTVEFSITEDGSSFYESVNVWHNVPEEGVDYIVHLCETVGADDKTLTYRDVLKLERKALDALTKLNELGDSVADMDTSEKQQAGKALVQALGIKGKGGKKKGHNK